MNSYDRAKLRAWRETLRELHEADDSETETNRDHDHDS